MTRSHPPTLLTSTLRTLREETGLAPGDRVVIAVSGGPDSMALLHVLSRLRARFPLELFAHGVDHGLRAEASRELDRAELLARSLGVPFARSALQLESGANLQARARSARYAALREAAADLCATAIATAHHADDRAETLLLRLLRGAGPRGLAVLPARSGDLVRPFLRARRGDIMAHIERHGVPYSTDPSNTNPRFLRARVRAELLPLLSELSPSIVQHLNALADQLQGDPIPEVVDEHGRTLVLNRAQVTQIQRARKYQQRNARISLSGRRIVDARDPARALVCDPHDEASPPRARNIGKTSR